MQKQFGVKSAKWGWMLILVLSIWVWTGAGKGVARAESGNSEIVLYHFNEADKWEVKTTDSASGGSIPVCKFNLSDEQKKEGKAYKLEYSNQSGWSEIRLTPQDKVEVEGIPEEIGIWIYEGGQQLKLFLRIEDASGEEFSYWWKRTLPGSGWTYAGLNLADGAKHKEFTHKGGNNDGKIDAPWHLKEIFIYAMQPETSVVYFDNLTAKGKSLKIKAVEK